MLISSEKANFNGNSFFEGDLAHVLENTIDLWSELKGKRLFITGGTGFFGRWLLETFLYANYHLKLGASACVLTRDPDSFRFIASKICNCHEITLYKGDIRNFKYPEGKFTHVIHLAKAAESVLDVSYSIDLFDNIVLGTRHILEFARHCSAKSILFTSSGAVYGKQPPNILNISEEYRGAPVIEDDKFAYGEGKRVSEFLCTMYSKYYGFETKIARCFAFVGPHISFKSSFAINDFIENAVNNESINIKGDGTPYRSYLYAADLMIWLWTILFKGVSNRPYNVGSENAISIGELAKTVLNISGRKSEIIVSEPLQHVIPERYIPSVERAREELGLNQYVCLDDAIKRTIDWYVK